MTTIDSTRSSNKKYLITGAAVIAVAIGAYGLGRVYPPLGPVEGTIAPAGRYVSPQVGKDDVTLGDTSVAQLMQTDAFELMTKDPSFAQLAREPAFAILAREPALLASLTANAREFAQLTKDPQMFAQMVAQAQAVSAAGRGANLQSAQLFTAMAQQAPAFQILAKYPQATIALSRDASALAQFSKNGQLFEQAVKTNPQAYGRLAGDAQAIKTLTSNAQVFNLIAQNQAALQSLAQNQAAFQSAAGQAASFQSRMGNAQAFDAKAALALGQNSQAYSQLSLQPQLMAVMSRYPQVFAALTQHPQVLANMSANARNYEQFSKDPQAFVNAVKNPQAVASMRGDAAAFQKFAGDAKALASLQANAQVFNLIAQNHAAFNALAGNAQLLSAATNAAAINGLAQNAVAFQAASRDAQGLAAASRDANAFISQANAANMAAQGRLNPQLMASMGANARAFAAMTSQPQAFAVFAKQPQLLATFAANAKSFEALGKNPNFANLAVNPSFAAALQSPALANAVNGRWIGGRLAGRGAMIGSKWRSRRLVKGGAAALLLSAATGAYAQERTDPPPPQPPTTTVVEPIAEPETTPDQPTPDPVLQGPEHVPPSAGGLDLSTLETNNFSLLYFDPIQTYLTPYLGRAFENAIAWHKQRFDWEPWDRTTVLLKDFGDYGNAAARSSPNNAVLLDVAPLSQTMETFTPGERFFTLINHELAHVATMDAWNKRDAFWRRALAGKPMPIQEHPESILYNYLATPRNNVPRWYLEGSAVFFETWMAGGLGRGQGAYDEMVFRAKVRDNDKLYSPLGLESEGTAIDFQVGVNDYLYGTRFFSWLALTHGPDKVVQWLRRDEGSAGFYATQFKRVFGKRLDEAWSEWHAWERQFQQENLAKLSAYPLTEVRHLSPIGLGSISRGFVDERTNQLVAAFRYPGEIGFVGTMDMASGKLRKLAEIKGMMLYKVTSLAFDPDTRKAYYTEDNYAFRDIVEVDVDTGKKRMLLKDARIGDFVLNPRDKSLWGIRHQNGYATIVRLPQPYTSFNQVFTFDYGSTPFDLDISPDGSLVSASFSEIDGSQSVRVWSASALEQSSMLDEVARLDLPPSTPEGFTFSPDGKSLLGTSYYTGVSNVFRFDIAAQKYEVLSNASTGFFRPMLRPDGQLLVYEYTGAGLNPSLIRPEKRDDLGTVEFLGTKVVNTHPELKQWGVGSPAKIDLDPLVTERGKYHATKRMKLAAAYPVIEGYKQEPSLGYYFHFEDPMQFHQLSATVSVSPTEGIRHSERLHADIEYRTLNWKLRYWHDDADIYDLAGPVLRSRKGDAVIISYNKTKIYDPPRQLDIFGSVAGYFGLEQLPSAQNIASPKDILSAEVGVRYTNTRKSLGSVDHEKGVAWQVVGGTDAADGDFYPHVWGGVDYGVPLPMANASAWIYAQGGLAGGRSESPLGAYYFGSFRNNYVDNRPEKRYRELESFPGFEIDQIAARKFAKLTGEVNLPPLRFAEVGAPIFYLSYARPALFAGTMLLRSPDDRSYRLHNFGAQVDLAFTVAMRLPMVLSVGVARGVGDKDIDGRTEWLASLKIM